MDDDFEWQPPSEAEMKIIQARRERSDKISKLMGDYMLKGYKMLGICCPECSTILLQDKHGVNYCVACMELDTDTDKDDPVLSQAAARSQIREGTALDEVDTEGLSFLTRLSDTSLGASAALPERTSHDATTTLTSASNASKSNQYNLNLNFTDSLDALSAKILWATNELQKSNSVEYSIQLCQLIKSSADAIQSIKTII
ncbi:protein ZNRD2-like isoform X2 [Dreissena polymorpha]|uniref:Sjoegren syndrome/scleroderma autoantigen 1 n=1 Tax=Dreissena polymorpha TaxID=45954 RepID=A0A9D4L3J7_DREPO|nr:protein ZNRD2-like isoform X2 [Dreissena polymorpha]KAH3851287.1 hypothetical protein DPMN_093767 [Dreissena polymorpha]